MPATSRRTVISGIGVLSPIGLDPTAFWRSLAEGRGGVRTISSFDVSGLPVRIAGELENFEARNYIEKKQARSLKMMARTIQLAVAAAQCALDDGKVDKTQLDPDRFGVEFGAGLIASELPELADAARVSTNCQPGMVDLDKWGQQGIPSIAPLWMLKYLPNFLACHVSMQHDARGPNNSVTESDVASLLALGEAFRILQRDGADFFLVGGAESKVNPLSLVRQCLFEPMSHRNEEPEKACRPFDRHRDGLVLGEGSTVIVFEELDHARRRGARVYAEVVGFGASFDRRQDGAGIARSIKAALAEAGIGPEDLDHINAHGLGSRTSDVWEARGLRTAFGSEPPPVFAAKGYLGNLGAGGGLTELAASVLGLVHGVTPATLNFEEADPDCPLPIIAGSPRPVTRPYFLKIGFTQMGQCAALVLKRWDGE
jgi:3-oxoacyl-[acyl-carrier-protein] synthase II